MVPALSIIVPTYQRADKLARALASVPGAVSCPFEVIVVDDCPQGSGFEAANRSGARYVCKAGVDRGLSVSRNIGLDLARGRWLCFLDDDDYLVPGGLEQLLAQATHGVVFGNYTAFADTRREDIDLGAIDRDALLVYNRIPVGAYIIERAAIRQRFDTRLRSHEDWDFLLTHTADQPLRHVATSVVMIDKSEVHSTSMLARRRKLSWLDHLSIWARFPASHLSDARAQLLLTLGIQLPAELLRFEDEI